MKKHPSLLIAALCAVFLLLAALTARAQSANPPGKMTYQGFLTDALGVPLGNSAPTNTAVTFRIYTALSNGTLKWSELQTVTIDKGHFSVLLGEGSPVSGEPNSTTLTTVFSGSDASDRFIEVTVGSTIITPRMQFQPAPYAMLANSARQLVDSAGAPIITAASSGSMTFSGAVTATTVTATTVTGTHVGNGTIPIGGIIMWSGATNAIPAGWALCNGATVSGQLTPNLVDRFIVGAGSGTNNVGNTGGFNAILLTDNQVPLRAHTHEYYDFFDADTTTLSAPAGGYLGSTAISSSDAEPQGDDVARRYKKRTTEAMTAVAATVAIDNRPAFYALAFIMRVQ